MSLLPDGVGFFEGNILGLDLEEYSYIFDSLYSTNKSEDYGNVASFDCNEIKKNPSLNNVYEKVLNEFDFSKFDLNLSKLWLVKTEYENVDSSKLPYVPHIDYHRFLKIMIYLDDVDLKDGPFNAMPMNPDENEDFRLSLAKDYKKFQANRVDTLSVEQFSTYVASAGSVLAFDTNCPHFAGSLMKSGKRRVMRFDFSCKSWERRKLKRIINFFCNNILYLK